MAAAAITTAASAPASEAHPETYAAIKAAHHLPDQAKLRFARRLDWHGRTTIRFFHNHPQVVSRHRQKVRVILRGSAWRLHVAAELSAEVLANADWVTAAVPFADRIWPGTRDWLLTCSASEGGYGGFVYNHEGSGAGGWMQFKSGTFDSNVDAAFAEARRRGFPLPRAARSWHSTLGQAVVGAYMVVHGQRGQWEGSGC